MQVLSSAPHLRPRPQLGTVSAQQSNLLLQRSGNSQLSTARKTAVEWLKPDDALTVSKLDAARRQLETSIRLYFANGDPVSIYTLTAAAFNVLRDLLRHLRNEPTFNKDLFLDYIKDEYHDEVRRKMNETENFFKHADRDPEAVVWFSPRSSEMLMWESCIIYKKLTGENPEYLYAFYAYFIAQHPSFIDTEKAPGFAAAAASLLRETSDRHVFLAKFLETRQLIDRKTFL